MLQEKYPIYDPEDDQKIIGYTDIGDKYVVTLEDKVCDYYEGMLVSGKYAGVDSLALNKRDLQKSIFLFSSIDAKGCSSIRICNDKIKYEILPDPTPSKNSSHLTTNDLEYDRN